MTCSCDNSTLAVAVPSAMANGKLACRCGNSLRDSLGFRQLLELAVARYTQALHVDKVSVSTSPEPGFCGVKLVRLCPPSCQTLLDKPGMERRLIEKTWRTKAFRSVSMVGDFPIPENGHSARTSC